MREKIKRLLGLVWYNLIFILALIIGIQLMWGGNSVESGLGIAIVLVGGVYQYAKEIREIVGSEQTINIHLGKGAEEVFTDAIDRT